MKNCNQCHSPFEVADEDRNFYRKLGLGLGYGADLIPEPDLCPSCRLQNMLAFRNERYYYQRTCDLCQKSMVSVYDPAFVKNVYCNACWWSDGWDAKDYAREFDFSKTFFDQYKVLFAEVPKLAMMNDNGSGSENSEYTYDCSSNKNAYLVIGSWHVEDGMYGWQTNHVKNSIDNSYIRESELMYNSLLSKGCYNCQDCMQCEQCSDCIFGFDLKDCKDCLFSAGLRNKQYYIWNQPYTKEEYFKKKEELQLDSWENRERYRKEFAHFIQKIPRRFANLISCQNCTGDYLMNSKDSKDCYNYWGAQNCRYMTNGDGAKDCYDCYSTGGPELSYFSITPDHSYGAFFTIYCWKSQFIFYSDNCHSSSHLFGSVGMKHGQYSILNKAYSQPEYEALVPRIIAHMKNTGEWGQFFRPDLSPFAYNETAAQEFFPLRVEENESRGYRFQVKLPGAFSKETIKWSQVPDRIADLSLDGSLAEGKLVFKEVFHCLECGKNYKILEKEFHFYKNNHIPLPRYCIDCRFYRRTSLMNPRHLYDRKCARCYAEIKTTYSPDRPEIVYCESCYLAQVY